MSKLDDIRNKIKDKPVDKSKKKARIDSSMLPFSKEFQTRRSTTSKKKK